MLLLLMCTNSYTHTEYTCLFVCLSSPIGLSLCHVTRQMEMKKAGGGVGLEQISLKID